MKLFYVEFQPVGGDRLLSGYFQARNFLHVRLVLNGEIKYIRQVQPRGDIAEYNPITLGEVTRHFR